MIGIINWLKGYLRIRVTGTAVERFINLCGFKNILLWDVCKQNNCYELYISVKAFKQLRPIVRKTKIKVVILTRVGLPFFMSDLNKRKIFLMCCIITLFFWQISGYFIWRIEIQGNYEITNEQIQDYLKDNNIKIGIQKKHLNIEKLEKDIRMEFPQVTWISGKIQGTTFYLDVKEVETHSEQQVTEEGVQYDLVAHVDGVIDSIIVRKGIPQVKPEEKVTAGMVLVQGIVPVMNDDGTLRENQYVQSDADIYIRYEYEYEDYLEEKHIEKKYTGRNKAIKFLRFDDKEVSFGQKPKYLIADILIQENTSNFLKELNIPINWGSFMYREYQNVETIYTETEAHEILTENFLKFLNDLSEKGVQIIEKDVTISKSGDKWIMKGSLTISEKVNALMKVESSNLTEALEK